jgi:hypothetical protein
MRLPALVALLLAAGGAACGDGPAAPPLPQQLSIEVEGRTERGATIVLRALSNGHAQPASFAAEPASSVQWHAPGTARLLAAGPVRFTARHAGAEASTDVAVTLPPSLVFERVVNGVRNIWRIALDGGDLLALTDHPAEDLSPSAAGGMVYFLSTRVSPAAVHAVSRTGGPAARITMAAGGFSAPVISPDGNRLAFLRDVAGVSKVFISERDGSGARRLTTSGQGVIENSPTWSPDGQRIAFVSTASGNADIFVATAAGGAPIAVGETRDPEVEPVWSPDGTRIVFTRALAPDRTELFTAPTTGGAAVSIAGTSGAVRPLWLGDGRIVFRLEANGALRWLDPNVPGAVHAVPHDFAVAGSLREIR